MKLATEIRWQDRRYRVPIERIQASEQWGYDAVFTAEAHGSDAFTPLGFVAGRTERLGLGTCIAQVTGRSPGVTAMSYQTLHAMSGGRPIIAGVGSSNPTVTAAVHGRPWGSPVERMRDFCTLLRQGLDGRPLDHDGDELTQPYGVAPPMATYLEPTPDIPILVGAAGPTMITLAAELADGWFPANFAPGMFEGVKPLLDAGFARAGHGKGLDGFDIWVHLDVIVDHDVRAAMRPFKEYVVRWAEMQRAQMIWRGYPELSDRLLELKGAGRVEEAIDAVPDEYVDEGWLVGPLDRVAARIEPWLTCGATGLIVRYGPQGFDQRVDEPLEVFEVIARRVRG